MNKEINDKISEIIDYIKMSDNYKKYLLLKDEINNDLNIKKYLLEIKDLQKDIVKNKNKELEEELNKKINILDNIPLYREYTNTVYEINNMICIINDTLNKYFVDKLS